MKKATALLLCICICLALFSCAAGEVSFVDYPKTSFSTEELVTKVFDGFTFSYPAEWSVEVEVDPALIDGSGSVFGCFAPHGESGYPASFVVVIAKNQQVKITDIKKEYILSLLEDMKEQTGSEYSLTDFGYYNLGGEQTVIYSASTIIEGVNAVVTQAMYIMDETLYIFNINTYEDENATDAYAVLSSLQFGAAQPQQEDGAGNYSGTSGDPADVNGDATTTE